MKAAPRPVLIDSTLPKESNVEKIEAHLVRKRKLVKGVDDATPEAKAKSVSNFLAAQRKQAPKPSVPSVVNVKAFLANELIEVSPVNVTRPVLEEPLQVIGSPISKLVLDHPLGFNIQHILKDLDLETEDSMGMQGDNLGHPATHEEPAQVPSKPLSPIPEAKASSRMPTPDIPQSLTPTRVDRALGSKRPQTSTASESESLDEVRVQGANWTVRGKLGRL